MLHPPNSRHTMEHFLCGGLPSKLQYLQVIYCPVFKSWRLLPVQHLEWSVVLVQQWKMLSNQLIDVLSDTLTNTPCCNNFFHHPNLLYLTEALLLLTLMYVCMYVYSYTCLGTSLCNRGLVFPASHLQLMVNLWTYVPLIKIGKHTVWNIWYIQAT